MLSEELLAFGFESSPSPSCIGVNDISLVGLSIGLEKRLEPRAVILVTQSKPPSLLIVISKLLTLPPIAS